ncbi:hypothetical protein AAFF_G00284930 [Aldrovandia affinis]|uniref:BPTI/Kunitz inhibitor domain-containing protein n=1 Tax=Aldrovandia affinis TaxID=143900 RepID=A0AAD7X153_9TELE|nr:hypothetical protein AAFF_G00284930 [Aldrovandia affinis]
MRQLFVFLVVLTTFWDVQTQSPSFCDLPMDPGIGDLVEINLYYNKEQDKCSPFKFAGKGGNGNRFGTDKMCMRNCSENAEQIYPADEREACHFRKQYGDCMAHYLLWYYDAVQGKCKKFHYSGCGGNGNRFVEERICNSTCTGILDDGTAEEDDSDTPVGLIIGIVLGIVGAFIIIAVVLVMVMNKNKPTTHQVVQKGKPKEEPKGDDTPLRDEGIEMQ